MFIALICITINTIAQPEVTVPRHTKILKITNNVNLRKEPNTSSAKLMEKSKEVDGWDKSHPSYEHIDYTWGEEGGEFRYFPIYTNYFMVTDETPEWYHGYALIGQYDVKEGYISKKAAKVKVANKINLNYLKKIEENTDITYTFITSEGKYHDYYFIAGDQRSLQSVDQYLFVGKNVNGVCFGKMFSSSESEYTNRIGFSKLPSDIIVENLNDISDAQFYNLLKNAKPGIFILTTGTVYTYYAHGSQEFDGFNFFYLP